MTTPRGRAEPTISVAMTTHDAGGFLERQLATVLAQSRPADEIVITDDCSGDGTWARLQAFAAAAAVPVSLRRNPENAGLRANVERTLHRCRCEVVVLADQDDEWDPRKLEAVAAAFTRPEVVLWCSDADLIDAAGSATGSTVWSAVHLDPATQRALASGGDTDRLLHGQTLTGALLAVRRSVLDVALPLPAELEGPDHLFLHDGWISVVASAVGEIVLDPRPLTRYRQHPGQATAMSMSNPAAVPAHGPPGDALATELARARLVSARLVAARVDTPRSRAIAARASFLGLRHQVRSGRPAGAVPLLLRGDYRRFARGGWTFLGDVRRGARARLRR